MTKIVYKLSRSRLMEDVLSRLPNQVVLVGVPYQTIDVHMFILQPKWLYNVCDYMSEGMVPNIFIISRDNI
jgi:hypothetical protein